MKILLDQGTPLPLRYSIAGHSIHTVREMDWTYLSDYELLEAARANGFEVLITPDKNLSTHHDLGAGSIAVVILTKSRWKLIRMVLGDVEAALENATPGTYTEVEIPDLPSDNWST
jgi:predicted nuclease of predicted toxin-antitoxin system